LFNSKMVKIIAMTSENSDCCGNYDVGWSN